MTSYLLERLNVRHQDVPVELGTSLQLLKHTLQHLGARASNIGGCLNLGTTEVIHHTGGRFPGFEEEN